MNDLREQMAKAIRAAYWHDVTHGDIDHAADGSEVTDWAPEADAALRVFGEWLASDDVRNLVSRTIATTNSETRRFVNMPDAAVYPTFAGDVLDALRSQAEGEAPDA